MDRRELTKYVEDNYKAEVVDYMERGGYQLIRAKLNISECIIIAYNGTGDKFSIKGGYPFITFAWNAFQWRS